MMLGILGLGSRSTLFYIEQLHAMYQKKHGGYSTLPFKMLQANFNTINPYLPNDFDPLLLALKPIMEELKRMEVNEVLVPNITLHEALDKMELGIKLLHPLKLTEEALKKKKATEIVLIGSSYTMESTYVRGWMENAGFTVNIPNPEDREKIDTMRKKLYASKETKQELKEFTETLKTYSQQATLVICCTELSMVCVREECADIDFVDMAMEQMRGVEVFND